MRSATHLSTYFLINHMTNQSSNHTLLPVEPAPAPAPSASRQKGWGCGTFVGAAIFVLALALAIYFLAPRLFPATFGPDAVRPEPTPVVVTIESIAPLAELATVHYKSIAEVSNEKIPDDVRKHLGAKERIVMLVYGDVKAGFDLSKMEDGDLWTDGSRAQLVLPPPEILSASIDYDRTHIVSYDRTFFLGNDPELEQATLSMGKDAIIKAALENDVLEMARQYGVLFFENHLRSLGFDEVQVIVK